MRTFVAINLPADQRRLVHAAFAPLRDRDLPMRWVAAESLHITVKFLGDTQTDTLPEVQRVLADAAARRAPFTLRVSRAGAFPTLRRASIIWVGVEDEPELAALHRQLEPALSRLGFPREQRPFRPHITVARARTGSRPLDLERLAGLVQCAASFAVPSVELMRSHTGGSGSRYETLLSCRLGESPDAGQTRAP